MPKMLYKILSKSSSWRGAPSTLQCVPGFLMQGLHMENHRHIIYVIPPPKRGMDTTGSLFMIFKGQNSPSKVRVMCSYEGVHA